jgi:hypothetical protein
MSFQPKKSLSNLVSWLKKAYGINDQLIDLPFEVVRVGIKAHALKGLYDKGKRELRP